ncbi:MAG: hypothetical protein MPJ05_04640 [Nitrosopumilus sp.]|nr:hypothetical protein [Nitrosopumilus sp.]MDA7943532.1 hypothetical protein [Nitrosopumilus sp.]MDA7953093.1 hypothetical protein [Nitrosopumilus sp.]MDA7959856.1 hypothetical protein [Nitrosopumilus sp.]MDA7999446.1 hypothetical protein [Nitrosopumilus sp.]
MEDGDKGAEFLDMIGRQARLQEKIVSMAARLAAAGWDDAGLRAELGGLLAEHARLEGQIRGAS